MVMDKLHVYGKEHRNVIYVVQIKHGYAGFYFQNVRTPLDGHFSVMRRVIYKKIHIVYTVYNVPYGI